MLRSRAVLRSLPRSGSLLNNRKTELTCSKNIQISMKSTCFDSDITGPLRFFALFNYTSQLTFGQLKIVLTLPLARAMSVKIVMHPAMAEAHRDAARSVSKTGNEPIDRTTKTNNSSSCDVTARVDNASISSYAGSPVERTQWHNDDGGNCS